MIAKHIKHDIVAYGAIAGTERHTIAHLNILTSSGVDDGAFYPAQHISVFGEDAVKNLRDFCNELLNEKATPPNA